MKAIVSPSALNKELKKMSHVVGKNKILPIIDCVLLEFKDDILRVVGTDLETTIVAETNCTTSDDFSFPVLMSDLVSICSACNEMLSFDLKGNILTITSGKSKFKITLDSDSSHFPKVPESEYDLSFDVDGSFYYSLSVASLFKSKQESMVSMNKVGVNVMDGVVEVCGTDGLIVYTASNRYESKKSVRVLMMPDGFIQSTKSFQDGQVSISDKFIKSTTGNTTVICRLIEQGFVDYASIIKKDIHWNVRVNKETILMSIKKMLISADNLISVTRMDFADGGIKVYSYNNETEREATDFVSCSVGVNLNDVCFNTNTLIHLLSNINSEEIEFMLDGTRTPMYVRPYDDNSNVCLVRPIFFNN